MSSKKLGFDDALQVISDGHALHVANVRADALRRTVWLMMYSAPGCLPDHSGIYVTKRDAIDSAVSLYADDAPRGFTTELRRNGIAATDENGFYRVEIVKQTLADCL